MKAEFTIVTPVRNGWPRIQPAVASVAAQRSTSVSLQHVVQLHTDSTDASADWLAGQHDITLVTDRDQGMYDAIQRGLARSDAPYCGWLNSDEQYLPNTLNLVAKTFAEHPEVDFVFGNYLILNHQELLIAARREIPARSWYLRQGVNYILSCTTFFRRSAWEKLGGFDLSYQRMADKELYLRAIQQGMKFLHLPCYLGVYGITGANISTDELSASEQERLRRATGAWRSGLLRNLPRLVRVGEKLLRGCYGSRRIQTQLFDTDGQPRQIDKIVGTSWRWQ